jgi:MraZ protein
MALFVSTVTNKIDAKGRVSVPAPFRAIVSTQGFDGVFCHPAFTERAIEGGGQARMDELRRYINALDPFSPEREALAIVVMGDSLALGFDQDGRISLPKELVEHAELDGQVTFVGLGDYFQMWKPENYAGYRSRARSLALEQRPLLQERLRALSEGGKKGGP